MESAQGSSSDYSSSINELTPDDTPRVILTPSHDTSDRQGDVSLQIYGEGLVGQIKHEAIDIKDEAVDIEESGARTKSKSEPARLVIASNRLRIVHVMHASLLPNVKLVTFKHDHCDLDGILSTVATSVGSSKFESIAMVFNCSGQTITLCGLEERLLTKQSIIEMSSVREFFLTLVNNHIDRTWVNARMDILMCSAAMTQDGRFIAEEIAQLIEMPCDISKDLVGADIQIARIGEEKRDRTVGSLYFYTDKLRPTSSKQTMALFEKIRTVGKGAYGSAVLYRKKDDDSLVILKEVNMHDLNAAERQMALNEVKVLSMLEHPNIISYFDSFEEDGILMIEMDYADGGTLAQFLSSRDQPIGERKVLEMFQQMVAAIRHMHVHNILHRDLKTANIFLTNDGVVKIGDFGISKMLTTGGKAANTLVGTPYYISPEMCEGKPYGPKSDIWSLGCILYEMACLERTFEASNLPAVVTKIVKGVYTPVKGNYSAEFKALVEKMLDRDPMIRPSADQLWTDFLPPLMLRYYHAQDNISHADDELNNSADSKKKRTLSIVYYLTTHNLSLSRILIPNKLKIKEVFAGRDHAVFVSHECIVLSYGRGTEGQLGHGDEKSRSTPTVVEALKGKSINKAACGDGFSVFGSSNGIVITCGDGQSGCLGHGDDNSLSKPKLIEALLHIDVVSIACGPQHVAVVGSNGEAYTWGNGSHGRLGLGNEENRAVPQKVNFSEQVNITEVFCGETGTMFLTDVGSVWACGNNKYNKLGLNNRQGVIATIKSAFNKTEVEGSRTPMLVRDLCRFRVTAISMGLNHTAVLTEVGKVITFGKNSEGQLGGGDTKPQQGLIHVRPLNNVSTVQISCTSLTTVVSLASGQFLFWGSRQKAETDSDSTKWLNPSLQRQRSAEVRRQNSASSNQSRSMSQTSLEGVQQSVNRQDSSSSVGRNDGKVDTSSLLSGSAEKTLSDRQFEQRLSAEDLELQLEPTPLMNFLSEQSESVVLTGFHSHGENILVLVETTVTPAQKKIKRRDSSQRSLQNYTNFTNSASSREAGDELSNSEASEMDTLGTIPSWIKHELADAADIIDIPGNADDDRADEGDKEKLTDKPTAVTKPSGRATVFSNQTTSKHLSEDDSTDYESDEDDDDSENDSDVDQESGPLFTSTLQQASPNQVDTTPKHAKRPIPTRSQGRPRASKSSKVRKPTLPEGGDLSEGSAPKTREKELQDEVLRLRREAEKSEVRLSQIEMRYNKKMDAIKQESVIKAAEKEKQLQNEVKQLRDELKDQTKQMRQNFDMVVSLQEQLVKMQQQTVELSTKQQPSNQLEAKSNQTSKSSICLVQ